MNTKSRNSKILSMAIGLTCMAGVACAAPHNSLADSDFNTSALVSELEPERNIKPQKPSIDLKAERPKPIATEATARINSIRYQCRELDVTPIVSFLEEGRLHKKWTFNDIQIYAMQVTQVLRDKGYFMAVAYVPPQAFEKKDLIINVIIGRYGNVDITNESMMTDKRLLGFTKKVSPGNLIKKQSLERVLTTVNEVPGMILKADMAPGKKPGTADISLDVKTLEKQGGYLYVDNYGSRSTGRWRLGANYHYNNVSRVGDQVEFNYLVGFKNDDDMKKGMSNYMLRYNVPYKNAGTMVRATASHMNYGVGRKITGFYDITGEADSLEFGITHPMHRTADHSHWLDVGFTYRDMEDDYGLAAWTNSKKDSRATKVEFHGFTRSERDSISYSASTDLGDVHYKSNWANILNRYKTDGHYIKSNFSVFHVHQFDKRWSMQNGLYGQYAWNNLDSSEDFYVGGESGVRAFPQGEDGGNHGLLGTVEFRYRTGQPEISLAAFIDAARVWYYKDNYYETGENSHRNLVGAGLGVHYLKSRKWMGKLEWATPIGNHNSRTKNKDIHSTWWFRLIRQF